MLSKKGKFVIFKLKAYEIDYSIVNRIAMIRCPELNDVITNKNLRFK